MLGGTWLSGRSYAEAPKRALVAAIMMTAIMVCYGLHMYLRLPLELAMGRA
jgi:hypothetical protein